MSTLTVDLASKFSAAMVTDNSGRVLREWDSRGKTHIEFAISLREAIEEFRVVLALIEDVPYGIKNQAMVKPVLRFQGIIIRELADYLGRVYFLNPSTWQGAYPGVGRAPKGLKGKAADDYRIEKARGHAEERGYTAPDLVAEFIAAQPEGTRILKKHTGPLEKNQTDYVDAFLMSDWVLNFEGDITTLSGVQPVFL